MMNNARYLSLFLAAAAGCGGGASSQPTTPPPTPPPAGGQMQTQAPTPPPTATPMAQMSHLRVIHASPDPNANNVAIYADGSPTAVVSSLTYRGAAGYANIPAGQHSIAVRPATAPSSTPPVLQENTPPLAPDQFYTVIAHGLAGGTPGLAVAAALDENTQPEAGNSRVRFFHALAGRGAVDICAPGATATAPGTPVFAGVAYGQWGTVPTTAGTQAGQGQYATVRAGRAMRLQIRAQNNRACTGAVVGYVSVTPPDRSVATAIAVGNPSGNPPIQPEVLVCIDAPLTGPSSCIPVSITPR